METPESKDKAPKKAGRPPAIKPKPVVETPPVEKVNTGDTEKPPVVETPLVDTKIEDVEKVGSGKKCPDHPKARAKLYGMCTVCYGKLSKAAKRKLFLTARMGGCNAHSYPLEMRKTWKRELAMIDAGTWTRPLKTERKRR